MLTIDIFNRAKLKAWTPKQASDGGVLFMELSKWDPTLTRLVCGKAKNFKSGNTCNVRFIDELADIRTQACDGAVRDHLREDLPEAVDDANDEDKALRRRCKAIEKRKAKPADSKIVSTVEITVPAHESFPQHTMIVMYGVKNSNVFFEMNDVNIRYVLNRCKWDHDHGRKGRSSRPPQRSPRSNEDDDGSQASDE